MSNVEYTLEEWISWATGRPPESRPGLPRPNYGGLLKLLEELRQAREHLANLNLHRFQVPIGDWSGDGHDRCDWGTIESPQPLEAWREAYLQSQARWPELAPDGELSHVRMSEWPLDRIKELCGDLLDDGALKADHFDQESQGMVLYVLAFCRLSDPSLTGELVDPMHMLPFYGRDDQGRHIGHIGYELLMPS